MFRNLPDELHVHLFRFFRPPQLARLSLVCKEANRLATDDTLWKPFLPSEILQKNPLLSAKEIYKREYQRYQLLFQSNGNYFSRLRQGYTDLSCIQNQMLVLSKRLNTLEISFIGQIPASIQLIETHYIEMFMPLMTYLQKRSSIFSLSHFFKNDTPFLSEESRIFIKDRLNAAACIILFLPQLEKLQSICASIQALVHPLPCPLLYILTCDNDALDNLAHDIHNPSLFDMNIFKIVYLEDKSDIPLFHEQLLLDCDEIKKIVTPTRENKLSLMPWNTPHCLTM